MRPEVITGALCSATILAPTVVYVVVQTRDFLSTKYRQRFGRWEWVVSRSGSFLAEGVSFRKEDPDDREGIAARILEEFFESEAGERALLYDSHRERYCCRVHEVGSTPIVLGTAWGR